MLLQYVSELEWIPLIEYFAKKPELKEGLILNTTQENYPNVYFSKCLVRVQPNKKVKLSVLNLSNKEVSIPNLKFTLEPLTHILENVDVPDSTSNHVPIFTTTDSDSENRIPNQLRYTHMNQEEEIMIIMIRNLCTEFNDIFIYLYLTISISYYYYYYYILLLQKHSNIKLGLLLKPQFMLKLTVSLNFTKKK